MHLSFLTLVLFKDNSLVAIIGSFDLSPLLG